MRSTATIKTQVKGYTFLKFNLLISKIKMSRSHKRTPIRTMLGKMSQHRGKKAASRRFRRVSKVRMLSGYEVLPQKSMEVTNTYDLGGDGKVYHPDDPNWSRK